jgi:hypothetical protein
MPSHTLCPPSTAEAAPGSPASPGERGGAAPAFSCWLLSDLEDFVAASFLPQVWVDLRSR